MAESTDSTPNMVPHSSTVLPEGPPAALAPEATSIASSIRASSAAASALSPVFEDGGERDDVSKDTSSVASLDLGASDTIQLTRSELQALLEDATTRARLALQQDLAHGMESIKHAAERDVSTVIDSISSLHSTIQRSTPGPPPHPPAPHQRTFSKGSILGFSGHRPARTFGTPRGVPDKDIAYRRQVAAATPASSRETPAETRTSTFSSDAVLALLKERDSNVKVQRFDGIQTHWHRFRHQVRDWAKDKEYLWILEHPFGPSDPNFDHRINSKIFTTLRNATADGAAYTYVNQAPEYNGWAAWQELLARYDRHTETQKQTLKKQAATLKHHHGTNIALHIDKFHRLFGLLQDCRYVPDEDEKVEWLMNSVSDPIYEGVKAIAQATILDGTLTFEVLAQMLLSTCFAKHPQFHLEDALGPTIQQNNTGTTCQYCGKRGHTASQCRTLQAKLGEPNTSNNRAGNRSNRGRDNTSRRNNDRRSSGRPSQQKKFRGNCSYCGKYGHCNRDCRQRKQADLQRDEKKAAKAQHMENKAAAQMATAPLPAQPPASTTLRFEQYTTTVTFPPPSSHPEPLQDDSGFTSVLHGARPHHPSTADIHLTNTYSVLRDSDDERDDDHENPDGAFTHPPRQELTSGSLSVTQHAIVMRPADSTFHFLPDGGEETENDEDEDDEDEDSDSNHDTTDPEIVYVTHRTRRFPVNPQSDSTPAPTPGWGNEPTYTTDYPDSIAWRDALLQEHAAPSSHPTSWPSAPVANAQEGYQDDEHQFNSADSHLEPPSLPLTQLSGDDNDNNEEQDHLIPRPTPDATSNHLPPSPSAHDNASRSESADPSRSSSSVATPPVPPPVDSDNNNASDDESTFTVLVTSCDGTLHQNNHLFARSTWTQHGVRTRSSTRSDPDAFNYGYESLLDSHGNTTLPTSTSHMKTLPIQHHILDSGAMMTMVNRGPHCTHLTPSNIDVGGAFGESAGQVDTCVSHYLTQLDDKEIVHLIFPNTLAVPRERPCASLVCMAQVLGAGHRITPGVEEFLLEFIGGGMITLPIHQAHPTLTLQPINPSHIEDKGYRKIHVHNPGPYIPLTSAALSNLQLVNLDQHATRRPDFSTPTAYRWHHRFACASEPVLRATHKATRGMMIRKDSLRQLNSLLPCEACLAGKMQKQENPSHTAYTPITNCPSTTNLLPQPAPNGSMVCLDLGINSSHPCRHGNTCFALLMDLSSKLLYAKCLPSKGAVVHAFLGYCQRWGTMDILTMDNAKEFLQGDMAIETQKRDVKVLPAPPYSPNKAPAERCMRLVTEGARSMLFIAGMDPHLFWSDAIECRAEMENFLATPSRPVTAIESTTGHQPNVAHWRIFGCEAMTYVEKDKRYKFDKKTERAINLGPSPAHTHSTYRLFCLRSKQTIYRRHVVFNETSFPLRPDSIVERPIQSCTPPPLAPDPTDLIGLKFRLDGKRRGGICEVTGISKWKGHLVADYITARGEKERSSVPEVRSWTAAFLLNHSTSTPETCHINHNKQAFQSYQQVLKSHDGGNTFDSTYLSAKTRIIKYGQEIPNSMNDASNMDASWFEAEDKENKGIISFDTWQRVDQSKVTPAMRKKALRAHRIYDIKRSLRKKSRLVANGRRQHPDTFTDTTCPVATLLEVKIFGAVITKRKYFACTGDSKNAYLHAHMQDFLLIVVPEGFPGAGEIAILKKALYGAKQSGRRYYDLVYNTLIALGLTQCPLCPCLFRFTITNPETNKTEACFILIYSDDNLIAGEKYAWETLKTKLQEKFEITYETLNDFLGLDFNYNREQGTFSISMKNFAKKFLEQCGYSKPHPYLTYTPGLTNMKVRRGDDVPRNVQPDEKFRHKTGSFNWLVAGIRYDLNFSTKELSRVADSPTTDAETLMNRQLAYLSQTTDARLLYTRHAMLLHRPPRTRRKPTDIDEDVYSLASSSSIDAGIPQPDDVPIAQDYLYDGDAMVITVNTDADLGGLTDTRQSTSGLIARIDGAIVHHAAKTEKLVLTSTTASEFVSLNRGDATGSYISRILHFYGNPLSTEYLLYTDSQTAEHLATQPNMSQAGRALDIRFHSLKQKYLQGDMRVGGVSTFDNDADICTKYLHPGAHSRHARDLFPDDHSHRNIPDKYLTPGKKDNKPQDSQHE